MKYKTRGNASPQGMQKVYFTGHPADCRTYFESISEQILALQNCAIFYDENPEQPEDSENFLSDLGRMQLVVIVVTSRYVYNETFAHNTVFNYAVEHHIPVLPILEESGIEEAFNKKCGDLQFLNPNSRDMTEISCEEKLKKFLDSVLVGDELAEKIRAAFDAYVFLSYRKKDRKYAQELMRLIHNNDFCRDIAIWYDEFLVPGENFNDAISKAMEKSKLFALAVTPNLLEKPNYIMTTEYPAAKEAQKDILPVILVPTDEKQLNDSYEEIPESVNAKNPAALEATLRVLFKDIVKPENNSDPQHVFFIGLAYLSGIDVEVNHERAVEMITFSAEHGLVEAIEKLVSMYLNGEGVPRSYKKAAKWQRKLADKCKEEFYKKPSENNGTKWVDALWYLGKFLEEFGQIAEAEKTSLEMLTVSELIDVIFKTYNTKRNIIISYGMMGNICLVKGDLPGKKAYDEKSLKIIEHLADKYPYSVQAKVDLSISYDNLGYVCKNQGDLPGAKEYYEKGLEIKKRLAEQQTDSVEAQRALSISYNSLGDICKAQGDLQGAREYYEKAFEIDKQLAQKQPDSVEAQRALSLIYAKFGGIYESQGDLPGAKKYYEKYLEISKSLASLQPDSVEAPRGLSSSYDRLGDICKAQGNLLGAKSYYKKLFAISKHLAEQQPDSVVAQRDLSVSYNKLGDICMLQEDLPDAKKYYEKALEIDKRLADLQPGSVEAQRDLCVCYGNLLYIYAAQDDFSNVRVCCEKCLEISKRLADILKTPQDYDDLAVSYGNLAFAAETRKEKQMYLHKAKNIWSRLVKEHPDEPLYSERLKMIGEILSSL